MRKHLTLLTSAGVLALLYGAAALRYEGFFSLRVFVDLLNDNSFRGILAVGMTFVILSGGIDLSVGAVMSLSSILIAVLVTQHQWHPAPAILAAVALAAALGAAMGGIIHATGIAPFIVTLAGMFFARGLAFLIHLESIGIDHPAHTSIAALRLAGLPVGALALLLVVLAGWYVSVLTPFGRDVFALGGGEEAARLMGRPVGRAKVGVYAVSGLCAGLAGAVLSLYLSSGNHFEGVGMELDAIAAVVVGGTLLAGGVGSVPGTLVGVLTIGIIVNVATTRENLLSSGLTKVAIGLLLLLAVGLQKFISRGLARR